mmetsp:Transcript_115526/g.307193  ORF Transcript_115526/g.307193 Transcript_115526/m.307193 type:complete len:402 (+) Transcript_115526:241-1446(+)
MAAQREVYDGEAVPGEVLYGVCAVPVEEGEAVLEVEPLDPAAVPLQLVHVYPAVVVGVVREPATLEVAECSNHRGAEVVAIPMGLCTVVLVDIQRGPRERLRVGWQAVSQPETHDLEYLAVRPGGLRQVDVSHPIAQEAESIGPHPLQTLLHDVDPVRIPRKPPEAEDLCQVLVGDDAVGGFPPLKDLLGLPLSDEAVGAHDDALATAFLHDEVLVVQAIFLCQLLPIPLHHSPVDVGELRFVLDLGDVERLLPQGPLHLDVPPLNVPAPVNWPRALLQCLADRLGRGVLLVADVRLRARSLRVRSIGQPRLLLEARHKLKGLVPVAGETLALRVGPEHVLGLRPLRLHADLQLLPLLRLHRRRSLRLREACVVDLPRLSLGRRLDRRSLRAGSCRLGGGL